MALESKKKYRFDKACTGHGCPIRHCCHRHFVLNYREEAAEVVRSPFIKKEDGTFKECKEYRNI